MIWGGVGGREGWRPEQSGDDIAGPSLPLGFPRATRRMRVGIDHVQLGSLSPDAREIDWDVCK